MSRHSILAPTRRAANLLAEALDAQGYQARATHYRRHGRRINVVLAIAPQSVVNRACREASI